MKTNVLLSINNFFQNIYNFILSRYSVLVNHYVYYMSKYFNIAKPIKLIYILNWLISLLVALIVVLILIKIFKKKKVIFYLEGKKYLVTKCKHKGDIIFPSEIKRKGKKFIAWCTDKKLEKEFLQTKLEKNKKLKLYAKFEPVYERVDIKLPTQEIEQPIEVLGKPTVVEEVVTTPEVTSVEDKAFDIGELYDAIRYEMLSYERAVPFKQLGIVRKQIVAEMFERNGKINLYFAIDPNLMREKGYNVMDYTEPEFKIVPCKKVIDSFDDYEEVVNIIKETMLLNNFVKSNVVMATKVKSDENIRKSGFAFYVKNDIIATSAKEYYILLRSVVLSYKMSAIRKYNDGNENNMILKIFKQGEKVYLYLALNAEMEGLEFVGYDKNFMDTPAMFEIKTADDCIKAQILIDKLMYRYGMEKFPEQTEIDLNEELEEKCGFGYKIRR